VQVSVYCSLNIWSAFINCFITVPPKSKSAPSDYDDVNSDDDEESGKEQKKKSTDVSVPGTCIYFFKLLFSMYAL